MGQLEDAGTVLAGDVPRSIALKLRRSYQMFLTVFGLFGLTIAANGLIISFRSGQPYTWLLLLFIFAIYALSACVPGASYLRLDPDGMTVRQSFYKKRLRWAIIISITGENGVRGGYFVPDIHALDRTELVRIMRDMWISAGIGNGCLPV